jgi:hypothetical protein
MFSHPVDSGTYPIHVKPFDPKIWACLQLFRLTGDPSDFEVVVHLHVLLVPGMSGYKTWTLLILRIAC